jgi:hypothetical protein
MLGGASMIMYKVFYKNYELKKGELMGTLIERRKNLRGMTKSQTGLRWARFAFGQLVKDKYAIFVVPHELNLRNDAIIPVEKGIFAKEEFLAVMNVVDQEIKREGGEEGRDTAFSVQSVYQAY